MSQWFYQNEGRQTGPIDSHALRRLAETGVVRPETMVRQGANGRWLRAEKVRHLFRQSTHASSLGTPPPEPPPLPPPVRDSAAPSRDVGGESLIRHDLFWPVTGAAIVVGFGTVLLLLSVLVFRSGSTSQQQAEKARPLLAAAQSAESGVSEPRPNAVRQPTKIAPAATPTAEPKSVPETGNDKIMELADLAELVGPSVVQVNVTGPEKSSTGSGFVLDQHGTIVTNYHVIEDATAGTIVFSDKTSTPITGYLGVWPEKDIALVRVECPQEKLYPLRLATSAPRQGESVAAFGSPLGLQESMSKGIVSALRESNDLRDLGPVEINAHLIQTDAPISHGNSGGPLVDMKGMVVGINTYSFRPLGGENVNFAVATVELPPLLLAKSETPSPLPASDPSSNGVRRILRRARDRAHAGDYDLAIADYTEAIRLDPTYYAYCGRGFAYYGKQDYDLAIADHTEAIRLDPKNDHAYCMRGHTYRCKADYDSAIADFTEAIRLDPEDEGAYFWRGETYRCKADYDSAIADYTEAIRLDPEYDYAYRCRAEAYLAKHDYDRAITDYTQAIRLDPNDATAYCKRGSAYEDNRDYDLAIADFTEAIRLDPNDAYTYSCRGRAYKAKGDYDLAIADFTQAIRVDPKYPYAYYCRGGAYEAKSDYESAIADFTQAIRIDPKYEFAYSGRGKTFFLKGDYDLAIADHTEAIRIDPKSVSAYFNRGLAYSLKGDNANAIADYTQVIRLDPKSVGAYFNRGQAYRGKQDFDLAIADFTESLRLDPKEVGAYCGRGEAYLANRDYDLAIADFTEAIRIDPATRGAAYHGRGQAYMANRDYDLAIADFTEAIRLWPESARVYYERGLAYKAKGQRAAAERDFAQAKRLGYTPQRER